MISQGSCDWSNAADNSALPTNIKLYLKKYINYYLFLLYFTILLFLLYFDSLNSAFVA